MALTRLLASLLVVVPLAIGASGCKQGCLAGGDSCKVPAPCPKLAFTCDASSSSKLELKVIDRRADRPGGWNALGAKGDVLLKNAFTEVVIAGIGNQNYLDPNGGSILDLANAGKANDGVNNILQVVGILPNDSARYTQLELIDERPARVAVQVRGTLDGRPDQPIYTRYELTPCDPGVRVRTELVNGSPDTQMWALVDGYYWSKREPVPFTSGAGAGFVHPGFDLLSINKAFRPTPFLAASSHTGEGRHSAISAASCSGAPLEGFQSDVVSAAGLPRTVVPPRGFLTFERFIAVTDSVGLGPAIDLALEVRSQATGEATITLSGKVERLGALSLVTDQTSVLISEGSLGDPVEKRSPWAQVTPAADGSFKVRVPRGKKWVIEAHSFGVKQIEREYAQANADLDTGSFVLPSTALVRFDVRDADGNAGLDAEVFVIPADPATAAAVSGSYHGTMGTCGPWLGAPAGASPACNRVLVRNGNANAEVPAGNYFFYGFHGPFWSLARKTVAVAAGATVDVSLTLKRFTLLPPDALSADLHVHGAASFDSSIPDADRVLAMAASDLDVAIATDHEVVTDYGPTVQQLGLQARLSTVSGVETTGHIPFLKIPSSSLPRVIGHYNLWPLRFDPLLPRNGAPFDELLEPGALFDAAKERVSPEVTAPLIELNHPWAESEFGRDLGWPRAIKMDLRKDLPPNDDGTANGMYGRVPAGASSRNDGHHAQEVMNGSGNELWLQYRAFWFYLLNQGQLKSGTANSDSHSLTDSTIGMPRNVVYANTTVGPLFQLASFNDAVRAGRLSGTAGPMIEATLEATDGEKGFGLALLRPKADGKVKVKVSAAPWIPVAEVRFVINGQVVKTAGALPTPADPFATSGDLVRYQGEVPLTELLSGVTGDAWLVIEAGAPVPLAGDLGGGGDDGPDGVVDTTDNNGDGKVDTGDVEGEGALFGPLKNPAAPAESDFAVHYYRITSGLPQAFTNPFVLDRNGDGVFSAPGLKGGR